MLTFRTIEFFSLVIRVFVMFFFFKQAYKHSKMQKMKDLYTITTFLLLGISLIALFIGRTSDFMEQTLEALYPEDQ